MGVACGEVSAWGGRNLEKIFALWYGWEIELNSEQINGVGTLHFT